MFKPLLEQNLKNVAYIALLKKFQRSSNILNRDARSKSQTETASAHGIKHHKSIQEVFFPPTKLEGIQNKIALVNGGTEGIGLQCVRELLKNDAKGVMIADTNQTTGHKEVKEFAKVYGQDKIAFIQVNPGNYMLLKNAFISTINFYKSLDIVINNIVFKEKNWEEQVDENIKGIVLSTQLCLEFMGRNNGGKGGILLNIANDHNDSTDSGALHAAVQDFIVRFDQSVAKQYFKTSNVKILTICKATFDCIGCDLATILTKGSNGCVWSPS